MRACYRDIRLLPGFRVRFHRPLLLDAYFSLRRRAGRDVCAQVDPRGGRGVPASSVSVAARRCITADAWTKVLLLGGARFLGRARRAGAIGRLLG